MPKKYFPAQNRVYSYLQNNRSNVLGNIWSSFNLDFQSNTGVLRAARKLVSISTSDDDADLGRPAGFEYFDDRWWAICGTRAFVGSGGAFFVSFAEESIGTSKTNYHSDYSDIKLFNDRMWTTTRTKLCSKPANGSGTGAYTERDTLGTDTYHQMAYLKNFNRLYYIDDITKISSIDSADVVANSTGDYFLDVGSSAGTVRTIAASPSEIWIGMMRVLDDASQRSGVQTSIFLWDGISSQPSQEYRISASGILSIWIKAGVPYAMDSNGRILKFTGYSFEEIARLPVKDIPLMGSDIVGATTGGVASGNFIHFNGLIEGRGNTLLMAINNKNGNDAQDFNENLPSGVWELDLDSKSLTHKHSFTLKAMSSGTITDFGQNVIFGIGAVKLNHLATNANVGTNSLIVGASYYSSATNIKSGIFVNTPTSPTTDNEGQKKAYFVTDWFGADDVADKWAKLWIIYRRLLAETDKLVFKYRLFEVDPIYATITWVNTTTFTTPTDVSAYIGYEVEVLQGTGSGSTAHIVSVTNNAGTRTVVIDQAVTGVTTGTAKARFQYWIKLLPEITGQVEQYTHLPIEALGTRIQIRGCLTFTGDGEFHKFILASNSDVKSEA